MAETNGVLRASMSRRSFVRSAWPGGRWFRRRNPSRRLRRLHPPDPLSGPAAPPDPVPGMTYIWASKIGCALDCNLENGRNKYTGGHATDDGPLINEAMAAAAADHPVTLIIDGSASDLGIIPSRLAAIGRSRDWGVEPDFSSNAAPTMMVSTRPLVRG